MTLSRSSAIAVRITAGANDKMVAHGAIVEANAERSTSNVQVEFRESPCYADAAFIRYAIARFRLRDDGSDPNGIRTRVTAVKGRCPGPLDDRVVKARAISNCCFRTQGKLPASFSHLRRSYGGQVCSCSEQVLWMNAAARAVAPQCWSNTSRAFRTSRWRASVSPNRFSIVRSSDSTS
jgi:hypothetical protein